MAECKDKNCWIHGGLKTRGMIFEGVVVSDKPKNTVIVEKEFLKFVPKYDRYERRKTRMAVHKPECMTVRTGDRVRISECKKISKTKSFIVIEVLKK